MTIPALVGMAAAGTPLLPKPQHVSSRCLSGQHKAGGALPQACCDRFPSTLLQEDRSLLVLINDAPKEGPGLDKLPKKYKHRKHASVLAGSCVRLEPLKPGPGGSLRLLWCTSGTQSSTKVLGGCSAGRLSY